MYNPYIDVALLGAALLLMYCVCRYMRKPKRGATRCTLDELHRHQAVRQILMSDGEYH